MRLSSCGDDLREHCRQGKTTSAPSFPPVAPDVAMQRVRSISANLSGSNLGTPCAGTHIEEGNETGEKCLQRLWLLHSVSKQDDGPKPTVKHPVVLRERERRPGTGRHLTALRQFVLSHLGCGAVPAAALGVVQSLEHPPPKLLRRPCQSPKRRHRIWSL